MRMSDMVAVMTNAATPSMEALSANREAMSQLQHEASLRKIRCKLVEFQINMVKDMQNKVTCMIDDVIKDMQHDDLHVNEFKGLVSEQHKEIWTNRPKVEPTEKGKKLPEKIFVTRDSLFTCLYRVPHMKTIYNSFLVILIVMVLNTTVHDYVTEGIINFGQNTVYEGMRGFWHGVGIWCVMQSSVVLVYFGLKVWAETRLHFRKAEALGQLWDSVSLTLFVSFQLFFMLAVSYTVFQMDFAFVSGCSVLLEMTRFVMKMHAFVRTNVPRILDGKVKVDSEEKAPQDRVPYPSVSQFLYYLFAPTFIYRDQYPRTSRINWTFALCRLLEVVGVMFFMANIHERYIRPNFSDFGIAEITSGDLVVKLFSMTLPGFLIFLSGFYCILHAWLNFTGELLRFGDRMYYKDWWTSGNFDAFYRNWNVVVHDWLYEFIYKDLFQYVFRGSKTASGIMVFMISAFIHEYILSVAFNSFLPIMLLFFGVIGVVVVFLTRKINKNLGNIFLWLALSTGNGLMVSLYAIEYYARTNCPVEDASLSSYFVPRMLTCNGIK